MSDEARSSPEQVGPPSAGREKARSGRLWPWFVAGFAIVFVGMALCATMYTMRPSGDAVLECRLWRYYVIEIDRQVRPAMLGPATSGGSGLVETAFFHVLFSTLGGLVLTGVGWGLRKIRGARRV